MRAVLTLLRPLTLQARRRPLRLLLTVGQLILASAIVTIAVHVVQAERSQRYARDLFSVQAAARGVNMVMLESVFTVSTLNALFELSPDVEAVATHSSLPYRQRIAVGGETFMLSQGARVDPGYLPLMGIEVTAGSAVPGSGGLAAILLEESTAAAFFGGADPIGQELMLPALASSLAPPEPPHRVVATYRYTTEPTGDAFSPLSRFPVLVLSTSAGSSNLVVLAKPGGGQAAREQIVAAARQVYARELRQTEGLEVYVQEASSSTSVFQVVNPHLLLFSLFGITALVLAALGVFSTTVVDVTEQTHEIGVRRALGASNLRIAQEYALATGLQALVAGIVGTAAALALVPALASGLGDALLPGVHLSGQPLIAVGALAFVTLLSVLLGFLPALHAGRLRPADAIREG